MATQIHTHTHVQPNAQTDVFSSYHSTRAYGPLLDKVYGLRYAAYSARGFIDKNDSERFIDKYDSMTNCTSFLTYNGEKLIGSIRISAYHPNSDHTIPVMENFSEELSSNIGMDKSFIEVNRFVIHPEFQRRGGVQARFSIYKNAIDQVDELQPDCVVAAVRKEHMRFYKMLNFEPISDFKLYSGVSFKAVLMACFDVPREFILHKCSGTLVDNDILPTDCRPRLYSGGARPS